MNVKSFKAKSLPEALRLVQNELGPDAAVLQTREVWDGLFQGLFGRRQIEVTASNDVQVRSPFPPKPANPGFTLSEAEAEMTLGESLQDSMSPHPFDEQIPPAHFESPVSRFRSSLPCRDEELDKMIGSLCGHTSSLEMPQSLFKVYTDLVEAEIEEDVARDLISRLRKKATLGELEDGNRIDDRLREIVKAWIEPHGPITINSDRQRIVALVGPTGVGKTTTIAKLAANFRLRDKQRVGLITVDTYRIAAVEQLRTYADIIDLPMEVVATQREMRDAIGRLGDMDLILMDTAGRSPRDEVRIQELKMLLQEAKPDEVHLVLSSTSGGRALVNTARKFADVGTTALLVTKLDEATGLGNLIPLLQQTELPLSYLTNGQSVPDDIQATDPHKLTEWILTGETP